MEARPGCAYWSGAGFVSALPHLASRLSGGRHLQAATCASAQRQMCRASAGIDADASPASHVLRIEHTVAATWLATKTEESAGRKAPAAFGKASETRDARAFSSFWPVAPNRTTRPRSRCDQIWDRIFAISPLAPAPEMAFASRAPHSQHVGY